MVALAEKYSREAHTPQNRTAQNFRRPQNAYPRNFLQSQNRGPATNNRILSQKYLDDSTGWYYYGFRYYSPELGRWINRDPIVEDGGVNLYAFLQNTPVSYLDLLGLRLVSKRMGQVLDGNRFGWTAKFNLSLDSKACEIDVDVKVFVKRGRVVGRNPPIASYKSGVRTGWDKRFKVVCPECTLCPDGWTIRVSLEEEAQDSAHYTIETTVIWGNINMEVWPRKDFDRGRTAARVVGHEVGHMLGNKDEYGTVDGTTYNGGWEAPGTGIMSNPKEKAQKRHYGLIFEEAVKDIGEKDCKLEKVVK